MNELSDNDILTHIPPRSPTPVLAIRRSGRGAAAGARVLRRERRRGQGGVRAAVPDGRQWRPAAPRA